MNPLGRTERALVALAALALLALFTWWIHFRFLLQHADSAFLAQMVDRMVETGRPVSQVAQAIWQLFVGYHPILLDTPADVLCKLQLPGPGPDEFNFFQWHTYLDLYLFLPLFWLAGGALGLSLLTAASYVMVVVGAYVLLRTQAVPVVLAALVATLLALHPTWAGGTQGDFYADRLFVGPAFVLGALLFARRFESRWVIPLAVLLALTSERNGLIAGVLVIGAVVLDDFRPRAWWRRRALIATGLLCIAFTGAMLLVYRLHPHYQSYWQSMHLASFLVNLRENPAFVANLVTFAAINLVAWGIPALGYWRGFLLAVVIMLPNVVGNYGGGEKTGFFTHYHSLYYPVLAAAICISFARLHVRYPGWPSWAFAGWLAVVGLAYNLHLNRYDFRFDEIASRSLTYPFKGYAVERQMVDARREMGAWLGQFPETLVSTGEGFMPLFSPRHRIAFYPFGLDEDADFVVLPRSAEPGVHTGAYSYLGDEETRRIDRCLTVRLAEAGFVVEKEMAAGVVLSRRAASRP